MILRVILFIVVFVILITINIAIVSYPFSVLTGFFVGYGWGNIGYKWLFD